MIFQQFFQFFIELFKSGKFLIIFSRGAWRKSFEAFRNPFSWTIIMFNNLIGNKHWKLSVIESCAIVVLFLDAGFNNVCLCTWPWNVLAKSFAITNVKITLKNAKIFNNCICPYITLKFKCMYIVLTFWNLEKSTFHLGWNIGQSVGHSKSLCIVLNGLPQINV